MRWGEGGGGACWWLRDFLGAHRPPGGPGSPLESGGESSDPADLTLFSANLNSPRSFWKGQKKLQKRTAFNKHKKFVKTDYRIHVSRPSSVPPVCPHAFLGIHLVQAPALRESVNQQVLPLPLLWAWPGSQGWGQSREQNRKEIPVLRNLSLGVEGEKRDSSRNFRERRSRRKAATGY